MVDEYSRSIEYLRVSLTRECNLNCLYCKGNKEKIKDFQGTDLSREEILRAVRAGAFLGVRKVRITGGEPLIRKDVIHICDDISRVEGIEKLGITTNGLRLPSLALELKKSGVEYVNISLDTLDKEKYAYLTGGGKLEEALRGIDTALNMGFKKVKLNCVLIKGINDDEASIRSLSKLSDKFNIDVRFIELMEMPSSKTSGKKLFVPAVRVLECLEGIKEETSYKECGDGIDKFFLSDTCENLHKENIKAFRKEDYIDSDKNSVAKMYRVEGKRGRIGLITPISHKFCDKCTRLRLTSDGYIKLCLHSPEEYMIRGLSEEEMREVFIKAIKNKPESHNMDERSLSNSKRSMDRIGG